MRLSVRIPAAVVTAGAVLWAYKTHTFASQAASSVTESASSAATTMSRGAVVALSHGGGPMPVLGDPDSAELAASLRQRVPAILGLDDAARRPKAIVVVTAHWSERQPTVSAAAKHALLYDYGGFPAEAYRLRYDAPGSPAVAERVAAALRAGGFDAQLDAMRGWDHGVFVPLLLVRPQADIPVVQLSVLASEDAAAHLAMGRALAPLRDEGIAIIGSGFASFHNLRLLFSGATRDPGFRQKLALWNSAVSAAATAPNPSDRSAGLAAWRSFPHAYVAHPPGGAEHFLPLLVCAGAAGNATGKSYADSYVGLDIISYYWE